MRSSFYLILINNFTIILAFLMLVTLLYILDTFNRVFYNDRLDYFIFKLLKTFRNFIILHYLITRLFIFINSQII